MVGCVPIPLEVLKIHTSPKDVIGLQKFQVPLDHTSWGSRVYAREPHKPNEMVFVSYKRSQAPSAWAAVESALQIVLYMKRLTSFFNSRGARRWKLLQVALH